MKIALVIQHADPARGGAERYTIDLADALCQRGHKVWLLSSTFADDLSEALRVELASSAATRLGRYKEFLDALDRHLERTKYDVVHAMMPVRRCDVYHPHAGIAAQTIAGGDGKNRPPLARKLHRWSNRFNRKRQFSAAVERELLSAADPPVVVCLSDYVKATLLRHYALPETKLAKLFNAVDLQNFDPLSQAKWQSTQQLSFQRDQDSVTGLMIAQDFQRKGLPELILAASQLKETRLKLVIVGKQKTGAYERLAKQAGVRRMFHFAGLTRDPYSFYRAADFFVLPTRHDPCSLVVLEALAMGLPVISTRFNGACEIMADGVHGFVLPNPGDINALVNAMRQMLNPDTRGAMARACLALRPRLSYEHHLDELIRVYQQVTGSR